MNSLERFTRFFRAVNGGASPYPWQQRLMKRVAETGKWPETIGAPTGSGKSSIVDIHVFLVAERVTLTDTRSSNRVERPPRRLVLIAPRRVLVDDQFDRAVALSELLTSSSDPVVKEVASALASLRSAVGEDDGGSPLGVARLRGGVALDLSWRLDPTQCQVICSTPQMWGSRLLLRGYRGSRRARNLESGLLAHDTVAVIDEAHLHQRLVGSASRVASMRPSGMGLQVVAMSATLSASSLGDDDLADSGLASRVNAAKRIDRVEVDPWTEAASRDAIVERARSLGGPGTVGVFVNTVKRALDVASELKKARAATVVVVCGRLRPADLARIRTEHRGLLDATGDPSVDYLVSTQSLEVGVDMDLPAMVTEIASASALAQRAGRLNRSGSLDSATFSVVAPAELSQADPDHPSRALGFPPYSWPDVVGASRWLDCLNGDASPRRITESDLPRSQSKPMPEISRVDVQTLAMTSLPLAAEPDVALYIEDPRDADDARVAICARDHLDHGNASRRALRAAPPRAHELVSMGIGRELRDLLELVGEQAQVIRFVDGEPVIEGFAQAGDPRNGDVIVIPAGSKVCVERVIGRPRKDSTEIDDVSGELGEDHSASWVVPLESSEIEDALARDPTLASRPARDSLMRILSERGRSEPARALGGRIRDVDVTWCEDRESGSGLLVVASRVREGRAPGVALGGPVTIDDHVNNVRKRMARIIDALDAPDLGATREQLEAAALGHDQGKRHPRFQRRMGAQEGIPPVAKPMPGHGADRGDGWRHEQMSLGFVGDDPLVAAIVGAHHGHGRPLFARDAEAVLDGWVDSPSEVADEVRRLFGDEGAYERDRAAVEKGLGVHRLAFLEALLRCADIQVSREGG